MYSLCLLYLLMVFEEQTFSPSLSGGFEQNSDDIYEKYLAIVNASKPILNENELELECIKSCEEKINLTKYIIFGTFDITKCKKNILINCSNTKLHNIICSDPNIMLKELRCVSNNLITLDNVKLNNLLRLFCAFNEIKNLDKLSQNMPNLKYLDCAGNQILNLLNLPEKLVYLNCENCKINNLNNLPLELEILICSGNQINSLDYLPDSLIKLECTNCGILCMDNLPLSLIELNCHSNPVMKLSNLPKNLGLIKCEDKINLINYPKDLKIIYFN